MSERKLPMTLPPGNDFFKALAEFPPWVHEVGFLRACSRFIFLPLARPAEWLLKAWTYAGWRASPASHENLIAERWNSCTDCEFHFHKFDDHFCAGCGCGGTIAPPPDRSPMSYFVTHLGSGMRAAGSWCWRFTLTLWSLCLRIPFERRNPALRNALSREAWHCPLGRHPGSVRTWVGLTPHEQQRAHEAQVNVLSDKAHEGNGRSPALAATASDVVS